MNQLVYQKNDEAVCDSLQVAEKFGKRHDKLIAEIRRMYPEQIGKITVQNGGAKFFQESTYENRGKQYPMFIMNRDGFSLLVMGFTGKDALQWKLQYIKAFNEMESFIREHQSQRWQETRIESKSNRRIEADEIKTFVVYAKANGSWNADRYYCNLSKLANKSVGIERASRDAATASQLNNLILIEHIIGEVIKEGIRQELYYKDIYKACKARIEQFRAIAYLAA